MGRDRSAEKVAQEIILRGLERARSAHASLAFDADREYREDMPDTKIDFDNPVPLPEEEDEETLAAIDRAIKQADEGRTIPLEEVRKMIPEWISKFESRQKR